MSLEKHYSLSGAAKILSVTRGTLKRWLRAEGILLPHVRRGSKTMIREQDIERVMRKRRDARFA